MNFDNTFMAAAPEPLQVVLAIFIDEDNVIDEFAAVIPNNTVVASGVGANELCDVVCRALAEQWDLFTLGGLDAFERAAAETSNSAFKRMAEQHTDAAYDFLVDNGYPLTWGSLFPGVDIPETAAGAAIKLQAWKTTAEKGGVIARQTMADKTSYWPLLAYKKSGLARFRTVAEAEAVLRSDPPDQSWMSGDVIDVASHTQWIH